MKRLLLSASALAALVFAGANAHAFARGARNGTYVPQASAGSATYNCSITGTMSGVNVAFVFGGEVIGGDGWLTCTQNARGRSGNAQIPIHLTLLGGGAGFNLTYVRAITVNAVGVGVNDPSQLLEQYSIGPSVGASLVNRGVAFDAAVRVGDASGFGFDLGLQGRDVIGLGAYLYGMGFQITRR